MTDPPDLYGTVAGKADEQGRPWIFVPIFQFFILKHFHASLPGISVKCFVKLKDRILSDVF